MRTTIENDSTHWPEIWKKACNLLNDQVGNQIMTAWIAPLELSDIQPTQKGFRLSFLTPNEFFLNWVRDRFKDKIEAVLSQIIGSTCDVTFLINESKDIRDEIPLPLEATDDNNHKNRTAAGVVIQTGQVKSYFQDFSLEPRYTFDTFVVGASNQFAHASAEAVAEDPGRRYNPLFIYSPPGLGKTHLLHAIGNEILKTRPQSKVLYISAEKFVNDLVESLRDHKMSGFREKYRHTYDVLLIDDIQFIAGKSKTEEEFFHTFNTLHASKRQIVLTSDRPPRDIESLEERIRTRFEWGLVSDIHIPEIETRIAILKAKAERDDIYLPDDVATYLASYIRSNVRELEGVLIRLQLVASLTGSEISLEMAKQELRSAVPEEGSQFTIESILSAVAKHFHLRLQDLKTTTREKRIAVPRQIAMFLIRKYTSLGFKEIGQHFGGKDHTTVLHACKKIGQGIEDDFTTRDTVEAIQNLL